MVHDFILQDQRTWNVELLEKLLCDRDVSAVLKVPLSNIVNDNRMVWRLSKDGKYTVKSTYRVAMNTLTNIHDFHVDGNWRLVWDSEVPSKVRNFLWKACREVLPSRTNLKSKGF